MQYYCREYFTLVFTERKLFTRLSHNVSLILNEIAPEPPALVIKHMIQLNIVYFFVIYFSIPILLYWIEWERQSRLSVLSRLIFFVLLFIRNSLFDVFWLYFCAIEKKVYKNVLVGMLSGRDEWMGCDQIS
jgi:hypothetical protein